MDYRKAAKNIASQGLQPIPISEGKVPSVKWGHLRDRKINDWELENWFKDCNGIALLCGSELSNIGCIDGDYKNQLDGQDYHSAILERIPTDIKDKLHIRISSSGIGRHILFRIPKDYDFPTIPLIRRWKTMNELIEEYNTIKSESEEIGELDVIDTIQRHPFQDILELRGKNSYFVFIADGYRWDEKSSKTIQTLTHEEINTILEILSSFDVTYTGRGFYSGESSSYHFIKTFEEICDAKTILDVLLDSKLFIHVGEDKDKYLIKRVGSKNPHSGYVFKDHKTLHLHSHNTIFSKAGTYFPYHVLEKIYGAEKAIEFIKKYNKNNYE